MFEFESMDTTSPSSGASSMSGLSRRHRRLSSSSQSLRELIDGENVIENITPSHCDLYLITRKKLSQINTNALKQSPDLRKEVLLTSIHRNITSKTGLNQMTNGSMPDLTFGRDSDPSLMTTGHNSNTTDSPPNATTKCVKQYKCNLILISLFVMYFAYLIHILRILFSKTSSDSEE